MRPRNLLTQTLLLGATLALVVYSIFPVYWMAVSSLRSHADLYRETGLFPGAISFESYEILLAHTDYPTWFMNSAIVAMGTVSITLVLSVLIAYALSRLFFRGKIIIIGSMLLAYMFPPLLLAVPLYALFVDLGIADTRLSLILSHCTLALPLGVWLLWGFFKQIPHDVEEAAMVDGYSRLGAFVRAVLPLALPGVVTVAIFAFLLSWTDYTFGLIMITSDRLKTLPVGLQTMVGSYDIQWGELMAGSTLITLPLLLCFVLLGRYFIQGLTAGATKG